MWDKILATFRETLGKAESSYLAKAKSELSYIFLRAARFLTKFAGFNCTEAENETALAAVRKRAWQALRAKIDEQTADQSFLAKLRTYFEERFRYDEDGVPRVWTPSDDIDGAFKKAKDEVRPAHSVLSLDISDHLALDIGTRTTLLQDLASRQVTIIHSAI